MNRQNSTPPGGKILLHHENPICHRTDSLKRIDSLLDNRRALSFLFKGPTRRRHLKDVAILKSEQMRATIKEETLSPQVIKTYLRIGFLSLLIPSGAKDATVERPHNN